MKHFKIIFYILTIFGLFFTYVACDPESDICTEAGTPRMKVKFKKLGKLFTVDSLTVGVILSPGDTLMVLDNAKRVDSVFVPMKINGDKFTDILVKVADTTTNNDYSKIRIEYDEKQEYVSPGCGIRKLYDNISARIIKPSASAIIAGVEINSKQVHDENTTAVYLIF